MKSPLFIAITNVFYPKDPAYLRLKMAVRTLISGLIAVAICIPLGVFAMIMVAFGVLFLAPTIYGHTYLEKIKCAVIYGLVLLACFSVGILVEPNFWVSSSFLAVGAFLTFYLRRFGDAFSNITIPAWVMLFLPVLFHFKTTDQWISCAGLAISIPVITIVSLLVLPEKKYAAFLDNFSHQLQLNVRLLNWLVKQLRQHGIQVKFRKLLLPLRESVAEILTGNQMISGEMDVRHLEIAKLADEILLWQYTLSKTLGTLLDSIFYIFFENTDKQIEEELTEHICLALSALASMTQSIKIINNKIHIQEKNKNTQASTQIAALKQALTTYSYKEHVDIVYFYNCYTCIEQYFEVLSSIRETHAVSR